MTDDIQEKTKQPVCDVADRPGAALVTLDIINTQIIIRYAGLMCRLLGGFVCPLCTLTVANICGTSGQGEVENAE